MPISFTLVDETIQLTDGNWNGQPDPTPDPENVKLEEDVLNVNLDLGGSLDVTEVTLDLEVIGDFNDPSETLIVTVDDNDGPLLASTLFDSDDTNDEIFDGENTGPTDGSTEVNGVVNPSIGAQRSQGNVAINGNQGGEPSPDNFTEADIGTIKDNTAVFTSNDSVQLSGDLSGFLGKSDIDFNFLIDDYESEEGGVDFAQVQMEINVSGNWSSDEGHAISNVVFYLECDDGDGGTEVVKIKIDDWDELAEEYASTELLDINEDTVDALAIECGIASDADDCIFIGMTIKAGNNRETEIDGEPLKPNQTGGEGEIIFGSIEGDYGKELKPECTVQATDWIVDDGFLV